MIKLHKLICGVVYNDANYQVGIYANIAGKRKRLWACPIYQSWMEMIKRCYSANIQAKQPTYIGCTVAPEWHSFMAFRAWMIKQEWKGNQLDKDILIQGNKVYSSDTCVFVSQKLNGFMNDHGARRGEWPLGVSWYKRSQMFRARCNNPFTGRTESLGYFSDQNEAHEAWRKRKHQHACTYADMQTDPRIAKALRTRFLKQEGDSK